MSSLNLDQIRDLMNCLGFKEVDFEVQQKEEKFFRFAGFRICQVSASAYNLNRIEELPNQDRKYFIIIEDQFHIRAWSHK